MKRSILNRLFDIREELEELDLHYDDALWVLINTAIDVAGHWQDRGLITGERQGSLNLGEIFG